MARRKGTEPNDQIDGIVEVSAKFKAKDGHTYDARYNLETFIKKRNDPPRAFRLLPEGGVKKWPPSGPLSEERGARL